MEKKGDLGRKKKKTKRKTLLPGKLYHITY